MRDERPGRAAQDKRGATLSPRPRPSQRLSFNKSFAKGSTFVCAQATPAVDTTDLSKKKSVIRADTRKIHRNGDHHWIERSPLYIVPCKKLSPVLLADGPI